MCHISDHISEDCNTGVSYNLVWFWSYPSSSCDLDPGEVIVLPCTPEGGGMRLEVGTGDIGVMVTVIFETSSEGF